MAATDDLGRWFAEFRRYAWRLEVLDDYSGTDGDDEVEAYQRTGAVAPRRPEDAWRRTIEAARARGATIGRVRLVGHPLTDYTKFELAAYTDNVALGEDVRILDRRRLDESWDDAPDVWLFDDVAAFRMIYGDRGAFLGAEPVDPGPIVHARALVEPLSVPLRDYASERADQPVEITLAAALAT